MIASRFELDLIKRHLATVVRGNALPSLRDPETPLLLQQIGRVTELNDEAAERQPFAPGGLNADQQRALAQVGLEALRELVERLQASMAAERDAAMMLDQAKRLC